VSAYLSVVSKAPGATPLVLVDGPPFTSWILVGKDLGSPSWSHQFAAARGTQGRRPVAGIPDDRQVTFTLLSDDYATKDTLATDLATLAQVMDEVRRLGGTVTFREHTQTNRQSFDVLVGGVSIGDWGSQTYDSRNQARPALTFTCAPYVLWEPCDILDTFDVDNVTTGDEDYTFDAGAAGAVTVTNGNLYGAGTLSTERRLIFTSRGYQMGDHEVTVQFTPGSSVQDFKAGAVLKRLDAGNYLECYIDDNGTNSRIRIDKVVAASRTNLSTSNLASRVTTGQGGWIRGRLEGNTVYAEFFNYGLQPEPSNTPTATGTVNLTSAEAAAFGVGTTGLAGLSFTPMASDAYLAGFEVLPWTYRRPAMYEIDCDGDIPGDAPALADVRIAPAANLVGASTAWQLFAWEAKASVRNLILNGDFEANASTGWTAAAVSGVTGAATSITAKSSAVAGFAFKYGTYAGEVVTPATANTGATYTMYQRFRAGTPYTALVWVTSGGATTNVRIRLGVSGDISSSTPVALDPLDWVLHTVTWTPTTSVDVAYLAVEVTAASATTFFIDGAAVYEGSTAPTVRRHLEGQGAAPMLAAVRAETMEQFGASTLTRTSDANAYGGFSMADSSVGAGGEVYISGFVVDPLLSAPDDYSSGGVRIEVWARVLLSAAFTGGVRGLLYAAPESGANYIYTPEFGTVGRQIPIPSSGNSKWRLTRLGTLDLRQDADTPGGRWYILVSFTVATGTNLQAFAVDDFYVVPERSRFLHPTGKPRSGLTSYPDFLPTSASIYRVVRSDLSSTLAKRWAYGAAGGVSGSPVELPTGQLRILSLSSSQEPDDTVAHANSESGGFPSVHLAVRPRSYWLRDA
jgi:hypothetical protein